MKNCSLFITAWICILISSCSQQEPPVAPIETPTYIGVIDNVYPGYKYALIRLNGILPEEGTVLISQSPENETSPRVGNLIVSSERLGNLRVPADIRSGDVAKGDLVFLYKNMAPPASRTIASVTADETTKPTAPAQDQKIAETKQPAPVTTPPLPADNAPGNQDINIPVPGQPLPASVKELLDKTPETYGETTR